MKKRSTLGILLLAAGTASAALVEYNFDDSNKIVDATYGTESDSYSGADVNTAAGVTASAFVLTDSRNQGTIGNANGAAGTGGTIGGSIRAGLSALGADALKAQTMTFSVDIAAGANAALTSLSFQHGYWCNNTTTDLMWYLDVVESGTTNSYNRGSPWTYTDQGPYVYLDDTAGLSTLALTGLTNLSNTTVSFTFSFSGQRSHNITNQSNWIDDVQLTVIPEPVTMGLIAVVGGSLLFIRRWMTM